MEYRELALNETLQLHELLTLKNLCLTKAAAMAPLAADEELKLILQNEVAKTERHIRELKELLEQSDISGREALH